MAGKLVKARLFSRHARLCWLWLPVWLCGCQAFAAGDGQAHKTMAAHRIESIRLERGCFGCANAGTLLLRRDGTASHTVSGNARMGTAPQTLQGRLPAGAFDKLARQLVAHGFFSLEESYEDPDIRDGAWVTISAAGGGQTRQVFRREEAGPARLKTLESAIEALRAQISFTP